MKNTTNRGEVKLVRLNTGTTNANTNTQRSNGKTAAPCDSYFIISQSRNKILERSSSCTSPQPKLEMSAQKNVQPKSTLPAAIHISAVNKKDRAKLAKSVRKEKRRIIFQEPERKTEIQIQETKNDGKRTFVGKSGRDKDRSAMKSKSFELESPIAPAQSRKKPKLTVDIVIQNKV